MVNDVQDPPDMSPKVCADAKCSGAVDGPRPAKPPRDSPELPLKADCSRDYHWLCDWTANKRQRLGTLCAAIARRCRVEHKPGPICHVHVLTRNCICSLRFSRGSSQKYPELCLFFAVSRYVFYRVLEPQSQVRRQREIHQRTSPLFLF